MPGMSHLKKNLDVLGRLVPGVAEAVVRAEVPAGFVTVVGTDGTETFQRVVTDAEGRKRVEWLGATSMPRASAEGLVSSLAPTGGGSGGGLQNGLGVSIGTGYEWAAFAGRLAPTQALYVYEPAPGVLRMVLEVCDLSALTETRRVVLLAGTAEEAAGQLTELLANNLGMEPPTVLHPLPTAGGGNAEARNALLAAGETIVRQAVTARQAQVGALAERLRKAATGRVEGKATSLAFLLTARYPEERPLHYCLDAEVERVVIDRPDTAGVALRMERLAAALERGPVRMVSDLFRGALACIPPEVPVETWVPPLVGPGYWERLPPAGEFAPGDRVVVHFEDHFGRLIDHGVAQEAIEVKSLPKGPAFGKAQDAGDPGRRHRVALIADLPRVSPEALDLVLPTHVTIYAAARELIAQDYLAVHPGFAPDLLRRALAKAGVMGSQAEDPALREPMYMLIRDVLAPVVPLLTLAQSLVEAGLALSLIGDWPELELRGDVRKVPFEAPPAERWREVAVLLHHSPTGVWSPIVWEAWKVMPVAGVLHGWDGQEGSLARTWAAGPEFVQVRSNQLIPTLKRLVAGQKE
jgi:hypothetical protein